MGKASTPEKEFTVISKGDQAFFGAKSLWKALVEPPPPGQIPVYAIELIHGWVCLKRQRFSVPSRLQNTDSAFFLQGGQKHFYKKS